METTNLVTKKTVDMTCKKCTRKTPEKQFLPIQEG